MKVNEFERDIETDYYKDYSTFTIESNLNYRYTSVEELLANPDVIAKMIEDHYNNQVPRLEILDDYYKAKNRSIKANNRRKEEEKMDYRPANNFAKVGTQFDVGYNTGIPIKAILDEENNEMIDDFNQFNDVDALNTELWLDMDKYGRAYELHYRDEEHNDHVVISNVFTTFVIYDMSHKRNPIMAVRYPKMHFGNRSDEIDVTLYTVDKIYTCAQTTISNLEIRIEYEQDHAYSMVPVLESQRNRYRQGLYEDVLSLIDLYDASQADTANYMSDLANATLVISGDIASASMTVEDMVAQKKANLLILESGVDAHGRQTGLSAGYIYKQYDVAGTEAYKKRLVQDIHKFMNIPDLTNEEFAGVQSGESMKYKLAAYSQMATTTQRTFSEHLKNRYRLLYNVKKEASEVTEIDIDAINIIFTANVPQSIHEELKILVEAGAQFSQETLLGLASFVENAQDEINKLDGEIGLDTGYDFEVGE